MANSIEEQIEELLQQGQTKQKIWKKLRSVDNPHKTLFYLNNTSLPQDRRRFQIINLGLAVLLFFITAKKLLTAMSFGNLDIFLLLGLVVPIVNIYVLREVLRFHRLGYRFLFVLSCLSLLQPENHHSQELFLLGMLIGLSGYLYRQMFPDKDMIGFKNKR